MANYHDIRYNFAIPSGSGSGAMELIKTLTASSSSDLSFVNGASDVVLDNTYRTYVFKFYNCHPSGSNVNFTVGFRDGSTDYDATKTTSYFEAIHNEADDDAELSYRTGSDLAQGTGFQILIEQIGDANDSSTSGEMWLFNPSSTTYVKHFMSKAEGSYRESRATNAYVTGYCNVTAAIDAVQFKFASGNIDAGTIKLYGIA
jgi:soluble cytochrome b562